MDFYENWDVFISKIDMVPEQLDGEKLIAMVAGFSRTREERELLGKEAAAGDKTSLESFLNAYLPMIAEDMGKYAPQVGYNRDILMNCVEKVREQVGNTLYIDDLEYNTCHYISWLVRNEVIRYIAEKERLSKEPVVDKTEEKTEYKTLEEQLEKVDKFVSDEKWSERIKNLLFACGTAKERQFIGYRYGLEDGVPKTLQETADKFGISRERADQLEKKIMRKSMPRCHSHRKRLVDFLNN